MRIEPCRSDARQISPVGRLLECIRGVEIVEQLGDGDAPGTWCGRSARGDLALPRLQDPGRLGVARRLRVLAVLHAADEVLRDVVAVLDPVARFSEDAAGAVVRAPRAHTGSPRRMAQSLRREFRGSVETSSTAGSVNRESPGRTTRMDLRHAPHAACAPDPHRPVPRLVNLTRTPRTSAPPPHPTPSLGAPPRVSRAISKQSSVCWRRSPPEMLRPCSASVTEMSMPFTRHRAARVKR